ncbi:MAG: PQQ-binding-like beta-propeller repeat protein, partial [Bacteroidota bacterium]
VLNLAEERRVVGQAKLGDAIDGAPVLTDRLLIAPVSAGGDGIVAYDVVRGRTAWAYEAEPHAAGLLLTEEGVLIAASLHGTLRALDPRSGDLLWEQAADSVHAVHASPVQLDAQTVAVIDDRGRVRAHALSDGAVQWTTQVEAPVYASPTVTAGMLMVPTTRGRLVALNATNGDAMWTYAASTPTTRMTSPATDGHTLYVGASDGTVAALDVQTGTVRWAHTEDGVVAAAPLLAVGAVVVGTLRKRVLVLDASTGTVRWQTDVEGRVKTAPLVTGGYLVVLAEPRQVYLFGPSQPASPVDSLAAR